MNFKKKLAQIETSKIVTIVGICLMSCLILYTGITSAFDFTEQNWTIEGDLVYFEDSNAYLSAYPHTVSSSQWVYFNLTSYNQSGDIDAVWGFKGDSVKPKRAELYSPHNITWNTSHSQFFQNVSNFIPSDEPCDYGDKDNDKSINITYQICGEHNYTEMKSECLYWNTTSSIVCFDSREPTTQPPTPNLNYTFYWHTEHSRLENWVDISNKFTSKDWNYQNMTKWWLLKNVTIQKDKNYQVRAWVDVPISLNGVSSKYFWAVKPTNMNLTTAKDKGYFYALDPWFNSSWTYKKNITINHSKVNGSQVNFPVLINLTDTDLRDDALSNGDDIVFTNSTGIQLDHEIEYFNGTDGRLVAWVRIPTLSNVSDTVIEMYYGNADASNQENVSGVWDDNFVMVQHLQETPTASINDSTSNDNDGTTSGMDSADQVAGQIDGSLDFDGGDWVDIGTGTRPAKTITVSAWIKADTLTNHDAIIGDTDFSTLNYGWQLEYYNGELRFFIANWNIYFAKKAFTDTGSRHFVVGTYDQTANSDQINIYIDNVIGTPYTYALNINYIFADGIFIGKGFNDGSNSWDGVIDEVRISNVARSAGWIATEYNNQVSPDSFYLVGAEVSDDSPPSVTSNVANSEVYTGNEVIFNITATDVVSDVDSCWYSLDSGTSNYSMSNSGDIYTATNSSVPEGSYRADFYCNDSFGNLNNTESISFHVINNWYSTWAYRKNIITDHTKVNGSQVNFPMLVNLTDTDLTDDAQSDGDDILFADINGNQLDHEIEYFNGTDGRLVAWVKISALSNTTDNFISMYYGNAGASNQENATGVWDDNFVMVQHMQEGIGGASNITYDSTSYGNNGTTQTMYSDDQVAGQIDGSLDFDGTDDKITGDGTGIGTIGTGNYTVSAWIYKKDSEAGSVLAFDIYDPVWAINTNEKIYIYDGGSKTASTGTINLDSWQMITFVRSGTGANELAYYINGGVDSTVIHADSITAVTTFEIATDRSTGSSVYDFNGIIDEVRISNTARTAGWIATEYNNQYSPDSFYSVGAEETGDDTYPQFSNYQDDNESLTDSGIGHFNVTVLNTNGTVLLEIDGTNTTATNVSNLFNVSYVFSSGGTYPYKWHSWGNGTNENYNVSVMRNYVVNSSAVDTCTYDTGNWEVDCSDNCIITENVDVDGNNISITGTGTFKINGGNVSNYEELFIKGTDESNICEVYCYGGCFG